MTRQVKRADTARDFRKSMGYPGYNKLFKLLEKNVCRKFPVTVADAKRDPCVLMGQMWKS